MPTRRRVLATCATGLLGALAGCADPSAVLSMDAVPADSDVARAATRAANPDGPPDHSDLLDGAIEEGGTEAGGERPPFSPERPVRHRDAVYDLSWEVVEEQTRTEYEIELSYDPNADPEIEIAYEDLPAVDRAAVREERHILERRFGEDELERDDELRLGARQFYDEAERETSVLVPEPEYEVVGIGGRPVEVHVRAVEVDVQIYRYEATEVATSLAAYGAALRERAAFELGDLDEAEREVVTEAIQENAYYAGDGDESAFDRVADRLLSRDPIYVDSGTGEWLVRYDGEQYWTELDTLRREELRERLPEEEE